LTLLFRTVGYESMTKPPQKWGTPNAQHV